MPSAEFPRIKNLPDSALAGIGESVEVLIHRNDPSFGPVLQSSHEMVRDVVDEMFTREGVPRNGELITLCVLAARIAVGKLATSDGFRIEFGGDWRQSNPHKIIDVSLRPAETPIEQAEVSRLSD